MLAGDGGAVAAPDAFAFAAPAWLRAPATLGQPAGRMYGLPVGITFTAGAFSEPTLIRLAAGFGAAAARRLPAFFRSLDAPRRRRSRAARDPLRLPWLRRRGTL